MSGPLVSASAAFVAKNSRIPPFAIEQSLRFDRSSHLSRTFGSTGNARIWSLSVWLKRAGGIGDNDRDIFGAYTGGNPRIGLVECGAGPSADHFGVDQGGPSSNGTYYANGRRRDPSAWYHLVVSVNYNTPSVKIWVNGVLEGAAQNSLAAADGLINSANVPHMVGGRVDSVSTSNRWDGYMAEFHFLDTDSQLSDPYDFGEFDDNGVWRPIEYTGSYGDNGFYMKFDPSATNGIGHDHSGNGNNFTASGFSTTGTGTDVMSDTPTTNYCTWNPLTIRNGSGTMSLTEGNLKFGSTASTTYGSILATIAPTSGKYYCELTFEGTKSSNYNRELFGIVPIANWQTNTRVDVHQIPGSLVYESNGTSSLAHQGTGSVANTQSYGVAWDENSNIGIAIDFDTPSLTFYVDGSSQGTFPYSMTAGEAYAIFAVDWSNFVEISAFILNAGQRDFAYTPPTGYKALNTRTLAAPDIADGSEYFNTVLYTGDGSTQSITGVGFQSDFTWIKGRNNSDNHTLHNSVIGATKYLYSNSTASEVTTANSLTSFDTDGFSLGSAGIVNRLNDTYVAWNWKEGATPGFDIINGTGGTAVNHNLGVAPDFVIFKYRDATSDWNVYHKDVTSTSQRLKLNSTVAVESISASWTINSTNFAYGGGSNTWVGYLFAEVESYSKFGSYTGNVSTDGPFVYCGFRPSFLLFKRSSAAEDWVITDSVRRTYNQMNGGLRPNGSYIEFSSDDVAFDFTANGFKIRAADVKTNGSGSTYIFMALAENPFGGSGVSPATAR